MATVTPIPGEDPGLDAQTRGPVLVGTSIAFIAASSVVVLLRLYTRHAIVSSPGPDDATIAVAQVLSIGVSVTTVLQSEYGLGRHVWMVREEDSIKQLKALFAGEVIYNLAQILTKISFLLQYRRIFERNKRTRRASFWLMIFLAAWGVTQEVLVGLACIPVAILVPSRQGVCIDSLVVWYLTSIMNIVTDFVVFTVPMPAIRTLHLARKQKILVASIFGLGFFTCIISIVRLFTLRSAVSTTDGTWDNAPTSWWTVVELNCGIICASVATLRPLLRHLFPSLLGRDRSADGSTYPWPGSSESTAAAAGAAAAPKSPFRKISDPYYYNITGADYALREVESGGSQDGLKENAASPPFGVADYARLSDKVSRLTTAIYGGPASKEAGLAEHAEEAGPWRGGGGGRRVSREIRVTTETTVEESRDKGSSSGTVSEGLG